MSNKGHKVLENFGIFKVKSLETEHRKTCIEHKKDVSVFFIILYRKFKLFEGFYLRFWPVLSLERPAIFERQ